MKYLLFVAIVLKFESANACTCIYEPFSVLQINESDIVFYGNAISRSESGFNWTYEFEVIELIKGNKESKRLKVNTPKFSSLCGFEFELNRPILVLAQLNKDLTLTTGTCSQNTYVDKMTEEFKTVLTEFIISKEIKFWTNIHNDTIAYGKISEAKPIGLWKIFDRKEIKTDGVYRDGKKVGTWNIYQKLFKKKESVSCFTSNKEDLNCKEVIRLNEYPN